jgi:hypothetical protein
VLCVRHPLATEHDEVAVRSHLAPWARASPRLRGAFLQMRVGRPEISIVSISNGSPGPVSRESISV